MATQEDAMNIPEQIRNEVRALGANFPLYCCDPFPFHRILSSVQNELEEKSNEKKNEKK